MIVYKIKNKLDGRLYIGQTTKKLEERWKEHKIPPPVVVI